MPRACILIKAVPTTIEKILKRIQSMSGVKKAYAIFGNWDIVAFIDTSTEEIGRISASINSMDGVRSSETLPEA